MEKKYLTIVTYLTLTFFTTPLLAETVVIDLAELARAYLENNLNVKIEKAKVEQKAARVTTELGSFDLNLSYKLDYSDANTPSSSTLDGSGAASSVLSTSLGHTFTLDKRFGSGTRISLPFSSSKQESNSSYTIFPVAYKSSLALSLSQPLLRVFKGGYFTRDLYRARVEKEIEKASADNTIANDFYKVVENYFNVLQSQKNLEVLTLSRENNEKNFEFLQEKKRYGKSSQIEILEAQSALAKSQQRYLNEQSKLFKQENELKLKIFATLDKQINFIFEPDELINYNELLGANEDELYQKALKFRSETIKFEQEYKLALLQQEYAYVDLLPELEAGYTGTAQGLSDTSSLSHKDTLAGKYLSHKFSLSLNMPIMRYAKKAQVSITEIKASQAKLKLENYRHTVLLELRTNMKELKAQEQIVKALKSSSDAQVEKFSYYQKRFQVGQISIFDLNQVKHEKEKAMLEFNEAEVKYYKLLVKLLKGQGKILHLALAKTE